MTRFVLEIDLPDPEGTFGELERILRYWAANVGHYGLAPGDGQLVCDSAGRAIGAWYVEPSADEVVDQHGARRQRT